MSYAVGLYFDISTENTIRTLWQEMADKGVSDYLYLSDNRPHVTLAIYPNLDIPNASKKLAEIASAYKPISVLFSYIGCFPAVKPDLFLGPVVTTELLDFHHIINQRFAGLGTYPDFDYYLPGYWVPHSAFAMGIDFKNVQTAMDIARKQLEFPFTARIEEIGLIEFRPVKHLFSFQIGKKISGLSI